MNKEIRNPAGEKIDYSYVAGTQHTDWLVVLGHGVTGNKDRPIVVDTAAALNKKGLATLSFSFAGNGDSEGKFVDSCITKEVDDLTAVLDAVADKHICYIGHSMGAAVGVLVAAKDARIRRIVSLAGMVNTAGFAQREFGEETPDKGVMWEEESCPLSQAFMDDLCQTVKSVLSEAKQLTQPWLLVHGSEDDVVLPEDSVSIEQATGSNVTLVKIEGGDHSFNEAAREPATTAVADWVFAQTEEAEE